LLGTNTGNANFNNADVTSARLVDLIGEESSNLSKAKYLNAAFGK